MQPNFSLARHLQSMDELNAKFLFVWCSGFTLLLAWAARPLRFRFDRR